MRATAGTALIAGQPARSARGLVGVVSHATYLYDELTAAENLQLFARLYGVASSKERVGELLARVGVAHRAKRVGWTPFAWAATARNDRAVVLHDPPVLLLDEPETGLDVAAFGLLEDLATAPDRTVIMTTHNLASGLRLGTRCAILARGRLTYEQDHISTGDTSALAERLAELAR